MHSDRQKMVFGKGLFTNLSKDGVFIIEFICTTQSKEELATIVVRPSICHGHQPSPIKAQS